MMRRIDKKVLTGRYSLTISVGLLLVDCMLYF